MFLKPELVTKRLVKTHRRRADAVCDDWPFWINKENITRAVSITMNVNYYKRIF